MRLILLTISILSIASSCQNNYDEVLISLSNNHVLLYESMGKQDYFEYFNLTEKTYKIELEKYNRAIEMFYNSDKGMIDHLLYFEDDTLTMSNWIRTPNPLSSRLYEEDLTSNSQAALILIHNFLANEDGKFISNQIPFVLDYKEFVKFYETYGEEALPKLRNNYVEYFNKKN